MSAMPYNLPASALISSGDRLITTLFFATLLHGIVILGVGFTAENHNDTGATVEVTLVQGNTETPPENADYLANADQRGEGNTDERVRPQTASTPGELARPVKETPPPQTQDTQPVVATSARAESKAPALQDAPPQPLLVARLVQPGDMADPFSSLEDQAQAYSSTPRERFIAVNTRASGYAEYLESWRRKVERLGNINYPDAARRDGLSGTVRLEVAINADGSIRELVTRIPSRYRTLDDSALRIVRLAAPFAPFPEKIRSETDVLRFVYDWQFSDGRPDTGRVSMPDKS